MVYHQPFNSLSGYQYNAHFYTNEGFEHHLHKNLELIYVIKGNVNCTIKHTQYRLGAGECGLCLPYDIHSMKPEENTQYWVLVFSEEYVRSFTKQIEGKTGDGFCFRCETDVDQYIRQKLITNQLLTTLTLKSCLYAVCEQYLNQVKIVDKGQLRTEAITVIDKYIRQNHTKSISLSDIAKELGYDYNYTSRYFRSTFNMTFTEFINIYRLETAIRLLEETDHSISAIALESGFQSLRSFHHFFQKHTNTTPSRYRKVARE